MQASTETKQIKTIGVNQLLNSLRTHGVGTGLMFEFIYQRLTRMVQLISSYLIDE